MPKQHETWIMKEKIKYLQDQVESLKNKLEVETLCAKIQAVLDKEKYDKMYNTAVQISRDFLKYVEDHPNDDSDDGYDSDDTTIDITNFFNASPPVTDEELEEVKEVFRI
jgi:hypothetical protein